MSRDIDMVADDTRPQAASRRAHKRQLQPPQPRV